MEIYNQYRDGADILLGRYCGMTAPGPIESAIDAIGIKIILHADQENVASGFKARYTFEVSSNNTKLSLNEKNPVLMKIFRF